MDNAITKQNETRTLAQRLKAGRIQLGDSCLILDISGSMKSDVEPGKTKFEALCDIVKSVIGNPTMIAFATDVHDCTKDTIPVPYGYTHMAKAFNRAKELGFKKVIMITDGEASDKVDALLATEGLVVQIMYVGAGDKPEFLSQLANKSGGFCTQHDLRFTKELTGELQKLLNPGADAAASRSDMPIGKITRVEVRESVNPEAKFANYLAIEVTEASGETYFDYMAGPYTKVYLKRFGIEIPEDVMEMEEQSLQDSLLGMPVTFGTECSKLGGTEVRHVRNLKRA